MARLPWDMTGKVVVITGGNAGIGLGFARGIARAGGDVVIWGRRKDKNEAAAASLAEFNTRIIAQEVDVAEEPRVVQAMQDAVSRMGRVDGVIANAGLMRNVGSFLNMTSEAWHGLLAVNQHGAFYAAREAARHMKARFDAGDPGDERRIVQHVDGEGRGHAAAGRHIRHHALRPLQLQIGDRDVAAERGQQPHRRLAHAETATQYEDALALQPKDRLRHFTLRRASAIVSLM